MNVSIKIGSTRINLSQVAYVHERHSKKLYKWEESDPWNEDFLNRDVEYYEGTVATVVFVGTTNDAITWYFYMEEAQEFLRLYDLYTAPSLVQVLENVRETSN